MQPLARNAGRPCQRQFHYACRHRPRLQCPSQRLFSVYQPCLRERPKPKSKPKPTDIKVNWFEQDDIHRAKRQRVEEGGEDPEAAEIKAKISALEEELKELRMGRLLGDSETEMLSELSEEDRVKMTEAIQERNEREAAFKKEVAARVATRMEAQDDSFIIKMATPQRSRVYLDRLNDTLRHASMNAPNPIIRREIWRWYSRCKQHLPSFLHLVPDSAWDLLWKTQSHLSSSNPDRLSHLKTLADDQISIGRDIPEVQKLARVEATFVEGERDQAIAEWEAIGDKFTGKDDILEEYWSLGIRMFSIIGNPLRAQEIAALMLGSNENADARILIPVITAWTQKNDALGYSNAWAIYVRLRDHLGPRITMEDYDRISMGFLNAGRKDLAQGVFKDMMLTGQASPEDSSALYKKSLGIVGKLQSMSVSAEETNRVSLQAMTVLPRKFQNKFFYGSWIKKLIGMGEPDAAAAVVELMYERGVKPDPKHVNGIIGAWLRVGNNESRQKAERMGWSMIQERLNFVQQRRASQNLDNSESSTSVTTKDGLEIPTHLERAVPAATIETFSILLLHYSRREMTAHVNYIQELLQPAEAKPNSYFMNHLLFADLRAHDHRRAWRRFQEMRRTVEPDMESFACLWDCMKFHLDAAKNRDLTGFPTPRALFFDMISWYLNLPAKLRDGAQEAVTQEFYDQVIRCFGLSQDLKGTLVAMHAMKHAFNLYATQDTARMVVLQVSRMGPTETETRRNRRTRAKDLRRNSKANVGNVTKVLDIIAKRRMSALSEQGIEYDDLDPETKANESLSLISELLRVVLVRTEEEPSMLEAGLQSIAWDMGVGGISLGEPLQYPIVPESP
ncbi:hypothetical protein L228DRAFT_242384 [Xylona heveae TC161]|uniref:Pentatricopeptide repeat protein n=1 Tax=Xylona heveae (strain CBS 132557 / TC161) TaxID=1328760 RepID=A0A165JAZ8_XYLHT|nr:hypothetical protein L228DRAFT_242384 [Xylona heveae TC161]KZF25992.1 hypothetical protein L228DRAFT_242384 [Xylona heveae TC161]